MTLHLVAMAPGDPGTAAGRTRKGRRAGSSAGPGGSSSPGTPPPPAPAGSGLEPRWSAPGAPALALASVRTLLSPKLAKLHASALYFNVARIT